MSSVEGFIAEEELRCLFSLAKEAVSGVIVEIGSYRGRSTVALACGSLSGHALPVYAIEPHRTFEGILGGRFGPEDRKAFLVNTLVTGTAEIVSLVGLPSEQVAAGWNDPVALLWIDGDHRYESVKSDFDAWAKYVPKGGRIALHDSTDTSLGPYRVVRDALESGEFSLEDQVEKIAVLVRS